MIIAVTGNTGSGKSTVARLFCDWGGHRIDADRIGREVWERSPETQRRIVEALGLQVAGDDGAIDRTRLGNAVFANKKKLVALDRIVQPILRERIAARLVEASAQPRTTWVLDAALLYEWGLEDSVDHVVVVVADPSRRAARISKRHGIDSEAARERVKIQEDEQAKVAGADFIIENNGSLDELTDKARRVWRKIAKS